MKRYFKYMAFCSLAAVITACADTDGNGEGEFIWEGSQNAENTSYRNPVWEPSMAGGTVFKAASGFVGISQETQWATGVDYACPSLQSSNLMTWSTNQQAFSYAKPSGDIDSNTGEPVMTPGSYPEWLNGKITHVSADFARTVAGANYWLVYASEADNAFGAATASSGMGPYTDLGQFLSAADLGVERLSYPHFSVLNSVNYYLGYSTEKGSYLQSLNLRRGSAPILKGNAVKVSGSGFTNICIFSRSRTDYYLIGTVSTPDGTEIRYGRSSSVTGPFTDRNGVELTDGVSNGELLVEDGDEYINPRNPMRMFESEEGIFYLAYNSTSMTKPDMPSGYARQPLFVSPVTIDDDGWFAKVITPEVGWTSPRYK